MTIPVGDKWLWATVHIFIPLLLLGFIFTIWKARDYDTDVFYLEQKWDVKQAVAYIIFIDLLYLLIQSCLYFSPSPYLITVAIWFSTPISLFVIWLIFRYLIQQPLTILGFSRDRLLHHLLIGMKWMFFIQILIYLSVSLLPETSILWVIERKRKESYISIEYLTSYLGQVWAFLSFVWVPVVSSIEQEILYRGLLYGALRKKIGVRPAIVVSSVIFMFAHSLFDPLAFILGCVLSYLYEKYRSLMPGIALHIGHNLSASTFAWLMHEGSLQPRIYLISFALIFILGFFIVSHFLKKVDSAGNEFAS